MSQNKVSGSDRPTFDTSRYSEDGVPLEVMVALANRIRYGPLVQHTAPGNAMIT